MNKIIGIICAWASQDLIELAIKQGLQQCDELHVCISAHSDNLLKFEDNTYSIAKKYESEIKLLEYNCGDFHATTKANILNLCLLESEYFKKGNWIWIRDVDEFFSNNAHMYVRNIIDLDVCDMINFEAKYFFINLQHYLISNHNRLFKIKDKSNRFRPTQQWMYASKIWQVPLKVGMFHYGTMSDPNMKLEFWKTEYPNNKQSRKIAWIDKIYRNYDLNNEEYWLEENRKLTGNYGPWICSEFKNDKNGKLFKYDGKHPEVIEKSNLIKIDDFRKYYNF